MKYVEALALKVHLYYMATSLLEPWGGLAVRRRGLSECLAPSFSPRLLKNPPYLTQKSTLRGKSSLNRAILLGLLAFRLSLIKLSAPHRAAAFLSQWP